MYELDEIKNTIILGHVLEVLAKIPNESIDMLITSPPYWGLRNYNTNPQLWDVNKNCDHIWRAYTRKGTTGGTKSEKVRIKDQENYQIVPDTEQQVCTKCGAWKGELGAEPKIDLYVEHLCNIFDEVKRILKPSGTCWVNIGDTYAANRGYQIDGTKQVNGSQPKNKQPQAKDNNILPKSLCGVPDRFKIAMIDDGWICRNEVIWHKSNAMCESVRDRFTVDYEKLYFFVKSPRYYFDADSVKEPSVYPNDNRKARSKTNHKRMPTEKIAGVRPGSKTYPMRNKRCVWKIPTKPFKGAHFATFPEKLIEVPILAGCPDGGVVLDIFFGSGTTGKVAKSQGKNYIGIELNADYIELAKKRLSLN
jgi:site-specific DNA-methyltransferase (cytosine-N4-specific)